MPLDYETLRIIWWVLLGVILTAFAVMDGFDLGVAILLPFVAKNDSERRVVINSIGPVWESNQVWLILGGGAIFAAWPLLYAVAFSGFYIAMFMVLCALILRPVGFKFRSKVPAAIWRQIWDLALFLGGFVPAFVFGVAVGNVLQGVPFYFDDSLRVFYTGEFSQLFSPFALICGFATVALLTFHGSTYLLIKTEGAIAERVRSTVMISAVTFLMLFSLAGWLVTYEVMGYQIVGQLAHDMASNPLTKEVSRRVGGWTLNYQIYPWMIGSPILSYLGIILALVLIKGRYMGSAFIASALSVVGTMGTLGLSMFPFLLPSSYDLKSSLTVWDASSSQMTLFIMLIAAVVFIPIIMAYTAWVFRVLRGKVTISFVETYKEDAY